MKNKINKKNIIIKFISIIILFSLVLILINNYFYKKYTYNYNKKISQIVYLLKEKNITDLEIANILNNNIEYNLNKYGINIEKESVVLENDILLNKEIFIYIIIVFIFILILFIIYFLEDRKKKRKMNEIFNMIEEVSNGKYTLDFENKSEDELSILRDNLYKITLKLKEEANNSIKDKISIKENLENISHQLKTPLTAINICLDNVLDNPSIKDEKRNEFLIDIKKEINNINFLVKNLLELSKFDANAINFNRKSIPINNILKESLKRVELLRELKNVNIKINGDNFVINGDFNWEIEAISNIIKNAIEYSKENSTIEIKKEKYSSYSSIKIINSGLISKEDIENVFKRFYKGKNSSFDSVGIGLSLAKRIIENDSGKISIDCKNNKTIFNIKYF